MTQEMEPITLSSTWHVHTQNEAGEDSEAAGTSGNSDLPTQALPGYPEPQGPVTPHTTPVLGGERHRAVLKREANEDPSGGRQQLPFPGQDATG